MKPKWVCHLRAFVLLWLFLGISSNTKTTENADEDLGLHQHHLSDFLDEVQAKTNEIPVATESPVEENSVKPLKNVEENVQEGREDLNEEFKGRASEEVTTLDSGLVGELAAEKPWVLELSTNESFVETNVQVPESSGEPGVESLAGTVDTVTSENIPAVEGLENEGGTVVAANDSVSSQNESPDEIPSFSEWTQKVLAEAEKTGGSNGSTTSTTTAKSVSSSKLRQKNYASPDCGAKLLSANPEAQHVSAVLDPARDEYLLSICSSKTWFVVELCEAIQAKRVEIANFELFSSSPKEFKVFISDRYPTREWALLGKFTATDERSIQSFDLPNELFGKFVKVELDSHYGTRYYCPISLFRVYGTSEYEVLNIEDENRNHDDSTEEETLEDVKIIDNQNHGTLFDSATKAVLDMVKKATGVFTKNDAPIPEMIKDNRTLIGRRDTSTCHSLRQSDFSHLNEAINATLSCSWDKLGRFCSLPWLQTSLAHLCHNRTVQNNSSSIIIYSRELEFAEILWGPALVAASCHWAQIADIRYKVPVSSSACPGPQKTAESAGKPGELPVEPVLEAVEDPVVPTVEIEAMEGWFPEVPETVGTANDPVLQENGGKMEMGVQNATGNLGGGDGKIPAPGNAASPSAAAAANGQGLSQQKESVFVRLSNRIKALERNMSLSSQYLEELSRRYKRQVDDMQKTLNRTLLTLNETLQQMMVKDQQQQTEIRSLKSEIEDLKNLFKEQVEENLTLRAKMVEHHLFLMLVEIIVVALLFAFCARRQFHRWLDVKLSPVQPPHVPLPTVNLPLTLHTQEPQASPSPSVTGSSGSSVSSWRSGSREPSPAPDSTLLGGKKKKKRKRSLPLITLAPNSGVQNITTTNAPNRLKSDNWLWHSRAKSLASVVIKENFEPLDMRGSF